jgi:RimJ/RimL family protein N-acetyltransferase
MSSRPRDIDFRPIGPKHFHMLWEWTRRPHVEPWWAHWIPATEAEATKEWAAQVDGTSPERGFLITLDGAEIGYIQSYRLSDEAEMRETIALGEDAVAADLYIADPSLIGQGLGPAIVGRFYLRMMDETGLEVGIIDPEVNNHSAIRAYEKAGFTALRVVHYPDSREGDYIMRATRADIERALGPTR